MAELTLIIGYKTYSSWSLRPWLVLKHVGAPFQEVMLPLYQADFKQRIAKYSPSGKVPVLAHGDLVVWDSLAICEYLVELYPSANLWPADSAARGVARSVSAEMHSGFNALRNHLPMNLRATRKKETTPEVDTDIARIRGIWRTAREKYGEGGKFLFGAFSIADAMFAPVVARFRSYGVTLEGEEVAYAQTVWDLPAMREWVESAKAETYLHPAYD
jgi:glutathione S-transferase